MGLVDYAMDSILDYLLDQPENEFKAVPGRVLIGLTNAAFQGEYQIGDIEYHATSRAVIQLEALDLIHVSRLYERRAAKANVLTGVKLVN